MKNRKIIYGAVLTALMSLSALTACNGNSAADKYDKNGRLILNLKNVYFDQWTGEDMYTDIINEKFGVSIKASNYAYEDWDTMVNTAINGNNLTDTIQFNLKAYNFGSTYESWVDFGMLKALPDDMSKWPNLKSMLDNISNIDALKVDGKLYGIPIANDIKNPQKDFSNFTYVYRRDWAKKIDEMYPDRDPVYREGDVYTWDEFNRLCDAFNTNLKTLSGMAQASVLVDEEWAFPSVTNFYKDAPHCYAKDADGKAVANFASEKYLAGLEVAKDFVSGKKIYSQDQYNFAANKANQLYLGGQAAILYDNYSLANYIKLRKLFKESQKNTPGFNLDDGTAFLKIKGPDGKFALEGTENWFSMTMFNADISNKKQEKILDILDYLLTEEGTRLAIYGKQGYDYDIVDGEVVLNEMGWEKDAMTGQYATKTNGAKYLRYMATLGNDTKSYDPFTELDAFNLLNAWQEEMKAAKTAGELRVVQEPADISWMSTPSKNDKTEGLLADANTAVLKYCFDKKSFDDYKKEFENNNWKKVLQEINQKLGK